MMISGATGAPARWVCYFCPLIRLVIFQLLQNLATPFRPEHLCGKAPLAVVVSKGKRPLKLVVIGL